MQNRLLVLELTVMMQWLVERMDGLLVCLVWVGSICASQGYSGSLSHLLSCVLRS